MIQQGIGGGVRNRDHFVKREAIAICVLVVVVACSGFAAWSKHVNKRQYKRGLEVELAKKIYRAIEFSSFDGTPATNWNQILPTLDTQVWIRLEQEFLRYPEAIRGFKNSIWEKYVFVEPGLKLPDGYGKFGGDVVMVQAGGEVGVDSRRYLIWRDRSGYNIGTFPWSAIQEWFAKAGREVPRASADLAPATPPGWQPPPEPGDPARSGHVFLVVSSILFGVLCVFLLWHSRRHETG